MASPLAFDTVTLKTTVDASSSRASGPRTPWSPARVTRRRGRDQKRMKVTKKTATPTESNPPLLDIEPIELAEPDDDDEGRRIDAIIGAQLRGTRRGSVDAMDGDDEGATETATTSAKLLAWKSDALSTDDNSDGEPPVRLDNQTKPWRCTSRYVSDTATG